MASDTRRARHHHALVTPLVIENVPHWRHTFPFEPAWWIDQRQGRRRQQVITEFEFSEIEMVVADLRSMLQYPVRFARKPPGDINLERSNVADAARLARRCLSLSWLAAVAWEHLRQTNATPGLEQVCRVNEIRAAELLANSGWRVLLDLPHPVVVGALCEAVARPDELYETESETD